METLKPIHPGGFHVQRMRGGFQPIPYQQIYKKPELGQAIQINPNIQAPINIGLGSLPLSLGLFAGSGMALAIGSQAPSIRTLTTIVSIGLAAFGALNLLVPKEAPTPGAPPTSTVTPGVTSPPISATAEHAFNAVEGRIISPSYGDTIDVSPIGTPSIPMRVRLVNKSDIQAVFDFGVTADEDPSVGARVVNSQTMRVTIPPGETRDVDVAVSISSWGALVDNVEVNVTVTKRRIDGGDKENLAGVMFMVE